MGQTATQRSEAARKAAATRKSNRHLDEIVERAAEKLKATKSEAARKAAKTRQEREFASRSKRYSLENVRAAFAKVEAERPERQREAIAKQERLAATRKAAGQKAAATVRQNKEAKQAQQLTELIQQIRATDETQGVALLRAYMESQ
jgi:hypothetical protein